MAGDEEATIRCATTKGPFVMQMYRRWSPNGYDRAVWLFEQGFYDHSHFFRVVPDFLVQFGISYSDNEELLAAAEVEIPDDPQLSPRITFDKGTISYAGSGDNSRTSHLFIAYAPSDGFGVETWETPVGKVIEGMEHVESFYSYGDMPPWGKGPEQDPIYEGPQYINEQFPLSDRFDTCEVTRHKPGEAAKVQEGGAGEATEHFKARSMQETAPQPSGVDVKLVAGAAALVAVVALVSRIMLRPKKQPGKKSS